MKDVNPVRLEVLEDARVVSDDENAHVLPFETGDAVGDGAQGVDVQSGLLELTRIEKKVLGSVRRRVSRDGSAALGKFRPSWSELYVGGSGGGSSKYGSNSLFENSS